MQIHMHSSCMKRESVLATKVKQFACKDILRDSIMSLALKMLSAQEAERYPFGCDVINEGRKILNQNVEEVPVGEIVHQFCEFAVESGIATKRVIHPDDIIVHIENLGRISYVTSLFCVNGCIIIES